MSSSSPLQPRECFIAALERRPITGRVPHFELVFFLTMEAFGKIHPTHRDYSQWIQMEEKERRLHREDIAETYIQIAERYEHSAIFIQTRPNEVDETCHIAEIIREKTGDKFYLTCHGDATYFIPMGGNVSDFCCALYEEPEKMHDDARAMVDKAIKDAEKVKARGAIDGFTLCSDYCFNDQPFMSPALFGEFIAPYLKDLIAAYREMGFYVIKHTDGNIMPIIDYLLDANPHALHSLDPQGGVDMAVMKRDYGDKVCLIGNVNCGLMQTGTEEEARESASYALRHGMPGGGYIFSTSNCIYTGLPLERYHLIHDVWKEEGNYPG